MNGGNYMASGSGSGTSGAGNSGRRAAAVAAAAASSGNRNTNRYSVTALYSMAAEQDIEVEDDLARGERSIHAGFKRLLTPLLLISQLRSVYESSREESRRNRRRTSSSREMSAISTAASLSSLPIAWQQMR